MNNNQDFMIQNGVLTQYNGSGGKVIIPEGVTEIGERVFSNRTDLTGIVIPEGVTQIGNGAFCNCKGLTSVDMPESVTKIGDSAFRHCVNLTDINVPEGAKIGRCAFYDSTDLACFSALKHIAKWV